jgi:hypothetical protein
VQIFLGLDFHVILYQFFLGGASGFTTYITKKAFETARLVMAGM